MKVLLTIAMGVIACIIAYNIGNDAGMKRSRAMNVSYPQTSCALAIRMAVDEVCVDPKICEQYKK